MSSPAELNPLFGDASSRSSPDAGAMGGGGGGPGGGGAARSGPRRRANVFHRESTRLRSNVADQVQRDLLPAGRMLSVFLVLCELLAEFAVLFATWHQKCDRPLRFWVLVLIVLQSGTVFLNCLNIWSGRDAFSPHRAGLSASDPDMYDGASSPARSSPALTISIGAGPSSASASAAASSAGAVHIAVAAEPSPSPPRDGAAETSSAAAASAHECPPLDVRVRVAAQDGRQDSARGAAASFLPGATVGARDARGRTEFVDHYVRVVNAIYLVWYIIGSVWVSSGGTCHTTAPHLYRLTVALTIIYYALLFLPLACFCLIVCCLPLFILVYRIMLPYAERERRRARAADPSLVQSLSSVAYSPANFQTLTGSDSVEDASCVICLCDYEPGEQVRFLPCKHHFHQQCVDVWLQLDKACCLCKQDIDAASEATAV